MWREGAKGGWLRAGGEAGVLGCVRVGVFGALVLWCAGALVRWCSLVLWCYSGVLFSVGDVRLGEVRYEAIDPIIME